MSDLYAIDAQDFKSIIDFIRFGLSRANVASLYYGHGTDNAWDDITALVLGSLNLPSNIDPILYHAQLTKDEKTVLCQQLERRIIERVPVPYLIHEAYFCDIPFYVDERVLIPRSPIAELIRYQFSPWIGEDSVTRILDLCTGSGCIAIACCAAFPEATVDAVDISMDALNVAKMNQDRHGLHETLTLIQSDGFDSVFNARYDIIVSNPPYVSQEEMQTLPEEYRHEPTIALESEEQGLFLVKKILHSAEAYLTDHGILVVEVGNSEQALIDEYPQVPFTWLEFEHGGQGVFLLTRAQLHEYFK